MSEDFYSYSTAYRKKPVVIEAVQWDNSMGVYTFLYHWTPEPVVSAFHPDESLMIKTLEGWLKADKGDYIIKGVKGELYACKPDIFALTYELADKRLDGPNDRQDAERYRYLKDNRRLLNITIEAFYPGKKTVQGAEADALIDWYMKEYPITERTYATKGRQT